MRTLLPVKLRKAYLEDNVLLEDVFDNSDLILSFGFSELRRGGAAVEGRAKVSKLGHLFQLFEIGRLRFSGRRCNRCLNSFARAWYANCFECTRT